MSKINYRNPKVALRMKRVFCEEIDEFGCMGCPQQSTINENRCQALQYEHLPNFEPNVNLFESVIRLVPAMSRNFQEARMLYDKCIGDKLLSHTSINTRTSTRCTDFSIRHLENNSISYPLLLVVCLFGFDIAFKHIMTVPACSSGTLTNVLPHRNAMPQTCIHKQYIDTGRPVAVLYIGVERHTGIHSYPF